MPISHILSHSMCLEVFWERRRGIEKKGGKWERKRGKEEKGGREREGEWERVEEKERKRGRGREGGKGERKGKEGEGKEEKEGGEGEKERGRGGGGRDRGIHTQREIKIAKQISNLGSWMQWCILREKMAPNCTY